MYIDKLCVHTYGTYIILAVHPHVLYTLATLPKRPKVSQGGVMHTPTAPASSFQALKTRSYAQHFKNRWQNRREPCAGTTTPEQKLTQLELKLKLKLELIYYVRIEYIARRTRSKQVFILIFIWNLHICIFGYAFLQDTPNYVPDISVIACKSRQGLALALTLTLALCA